MDMVLFWVTLAAATTLLAMGALMLVAPRAISKSLPEDESDGWSLPSLNGLAAFFRFQRWTSRTRIRQVVWGACGVAGGVYFVWLAFHMK